MGKLTLQFDIEPLKTAIASRLTTMVVNALSTGDSSIYDRLSFDVKDIVKQAYAAVDMNKVKEEVTVRLQTEIATRIINNLQTELGHDVKAIMSNSQIRDDFKYMLRKQADDLLSKIKEDDK
jgi:hypothetical protein